MPPQVQRQKILWALTFGWDFTQLQGLTGRRPYGTTLRDLVALAERHPETSWDGASVRRMIAAWQTWTGLPVDDPAVLGTALIPTLDGSPAHPAVWEFYGSSLTPYTTMTYQEHLDFLARLAKLGAGRLAPALLAGRRDTLVRLMAAVCAFPRATPDARHPVVQYLLRHEHNRPLLTEAPGLTVNECLTMGLHTTGLDTTPLGALDPEFLASAALDVALETQPEAANRATLAVLPPYCTGVIEWNRFRAWWESLRTELHRATFLLLPQVHPWEWVEARHPLRYPPKPVVREPEPERETGPAQKDAVLQVRVAAPPVAVCRAITTLLDLRPDSPEEHYERASRLVLRDVEVALGPDKVSVIGFGLHSVSKSMTGSEWNHQIRKNRPRLSADTQVPALVALLRWARGATLSTAATTIKAMPGVPLIPLAPNQPFPAPASIIKTWVTLGASYPEDEDGRTLDGVP